MQEMGINITGRSPKALTRKMLELIESSPRLEAAMSKEVATLAGGCFWCLEAIFYELNGVEQVTSGYSGGTVVNHLIRR